MFYTKKDDDKKKMGHLKGMLEQVRTNRAMTDYCKKWKEQRPKEIKKEIKVLNLQEET